jgi:hypothetical protein
MSSAAIRRLVLALALLVPSLAFAQGGQVTLIQSSLEPLPNCTPASAGQLQPQIWDVTAQQMKTCTAPNTWSQMGGGSGGGPGSGTQYAVADWATSSTLGSIYSTLFGQLLQAQNGAAPSWSVQGLPLGNGGVPSTCPSGYTVQADTSTSILDRGTVLIFNSSSACAVTLPDPSTTGMGSSFPVKMSNIGAGTVTVTRASAATFTIVTGSSVIQSATSFTLLTGQFITLHSDNTNWWGEEWAGSGTVSSGTQCYPTEYAATGTTVVSSSLTCDASAFSGATWLAQVIAAANSTQCNDACTVLIPPSIASTANYVTGTLPSGVVYEFTGPGTFGVCSITSNDAHFKLLNPGNALLQMNSGGSGCTAITTTAQATLQANDRAIISGVRIDCLSQPSSSGMFLSGATAQMFTENNSVQGCTIVGIEWSDEQFIISVYDHLHNNYVNAKIYSITGGGNSNGFYNMQAVNPGSGVNVIVANQQGAGAVDGQYDDIFHQPEFQNGYVAELAVFGDATTDYSTTVHQIGGAYEHGGGFRYTATFTNSSASIGATNTLSAGQTVQFITTGTLPTNFAVGTTYYVISTGLSGSAFEVSATSGGSAITAGSAGSGTQTVFPVAVIDGNTIKQAGVYGNTAFIDIQEEDVQEAVVTPLHFVENNSYLVLENDGGYGVSGGIIADADSTSIVLWLGAQRWLPSATLTSGAGTFLGTPASASYSGYATSVVSGPLALAIGSASAPAYSFAAHTSSGLYSGSSGIPGITANGTASAVFFTSGPELLPASLYAWASSSSFGSVDTGLSRCSAGVVCVGTGAQGNVAGTLSAEILQENDGSFGSQQIHSPSACATSYGTTSVNTGSATTTTALNCLPANSVIDAIVYRVTTAITTAASFTVGQSGSASQFCSTQSTLTLGATGTCIPSAYAAQASAAAVTVTFNTTPGAGAIRLIVYYHTWTAPTS